MEDKYIAAEAQKLYGKDDKANWYDAIENLKIFPARTYNARDVEIDARFTEDGLYGDNAFGFIVQAFPRRSSDKMMFWHYCRETFERDLFAATRRLLYDYRYVFYIKPKPGQEYRVPNFIRNIEIDRLNLDELTTFKQVYNSYIDRPVIYIKPSSFWSNCPMRFSLLTILCRAGRYYFFNSIEDALMSYDYSRTTFAAINLFFQGRRRYIGQPLNHWARKWVYHFNNLHESQVHELVA